MYVQLFETLVQGPLQQMDSFFSVCIQTPIHCPTVLRLLLMVK